MIVIYGQDVETNNDGSSIETSSDGSVRHYKDGMYHREDGPAVIHADGWMGWWLNGQHHREDGPAAIWPNGFQEWWYKGKRLSCQSQEEFERLLKLKAFW